jgi:hypothetical protein
MPIHNDNELMYATGMANPKFRGAIRSQVMDIVWSSKIAKKIVDFFIQPELDGQPFVPKALYAHMSEDYIKTEIHEVLNLCMEVTETYRNDINDQYTNQMIKSFRKFYQNRVVQELFKEHQFDPEKIIEVIGGLKDFSSNTLPLWNMSELDVDTVEAEDGGLNTVVPTSFDFIKRANFPYEGYTNGQVCMVCAAPGVGKTLFLAHEVVAMMRHNAHLDQLMIEKPDEWPAEETEEQKIKVFWLAAGDMTRYDFICRLTAIHLGLPLNTVRAAPKKYYTEKMQHFFRYVDISVCPAHYVDAYGVKHFIETQVATKTDPNVIIIDYDANLITSKGDDMYRAGEEVYNIASALAKPIGKPGRLVFVASQPKVFFWDHDLVPKEAAAESSRKQAIIDMMVTIGRNPACLSDHAGIMYVAKMRRGKEGEKEFYRLVEGHIVPIEVNDYNSLKTSGQAPGKTKKNGNSRISGWLKHQ